MRLSWVVALLLVSACGGSGSERGASDLQPYEYRSDRSYMRLPANLAGAGIGAHEDAPELLHCYEAQAAAGPETITHLQLELVLEGGTLHPRLAQEQTDLSGDFSSCVQHVVVDWDLEPEQGNEGEIVPIEFGPVE